MAANTARMRKFIQVARRKLGLDDATYREFLESATRTRNAPGKTSTAEGVMDAKDLWRVVQALKEKGFAMEPQQGDITKADDDQSRLVRHQWLKLKHYGVLRDSSERALVKYVKRIAKVDRLQWLTVKKAQLVIETLKKWVARIEDGIINEALQSGRLTFPGGYADQQAYAAALAGGLVSIQEAAQFREAKDRYLGTYKPEKRAVEEKRKAV